VKRFSIVNPCNILSIALLVVVQLACASVHASDDPQDLYFEELRGEKAIEWVNKNNARSAETLEKDARYEPLRKELLSLYDSKDKLTGMSIRLEYVSDFWKDDKNPRGLYRRIKLKDYLAGKRNWEVILDLDKLAADEKETWVWGGASQFKERILFSFSRGGGDATVTREFDLKTRTWVKDGFNLPEAKNDISWVDENTVVLGLATNKDEVTKSGYPFVLRLWKRGEKFEAAPVIFKGESTDVSAGGYANRYKIDGPVKQMLFYRWTDFYNADYWTLKGKELVKINFPTDANINIQNDFMYLTLKSDWKFKEQTLTTGSLVRFNFEKFLKGKAKPEVLFAPTERLVMDSYSLINGRIFLALTEDVKDKWVELKGKPGKWVQEPVALPANSTISLLSASEENNNLVFEVENFLEPETRYLYDLSTNKISKVEQAPVRFDPSPYKVEQKFATSKDGTRVPYFVVSRKDITLDGKNPTVIWGYGGFEVTYKPYYSGTTGLSWLRSGGVYVLANIRGGGEYGPKWHKAGLKENRQRVFDDFYAVAEDLHRTRVTSPEKTGIVGGSNGGLLMGVALTQRPELYKAIAIQVPLLDMLRFHKLLAGDSWTGEYGSPEDPKMRPILEGYSPYHNIKPNVAYPEPFFMTSTEDDRVHPGHARRTAAKMEEMGFPFLYYENTEGGHGGSVNNEQTAKWYALEYVYFYRKLIDAK
jgi:prolyl oligopeptidase